MKGIIFVSAIAIILSLYSAMPVVVVAQAGLIPCGTEDVLDNKTGTETVDRKGDGVVDKPCGWDDFITLVSKVANYLIILGAAFSAVAFGWAGFLMMTAGGEMGKIEKAKSIFGKVLVGFLLMLSAWLIVHAINAGLLASDFINSSEVKPL